MAKRRTGKKRRTAAQKRATKKMIAANRKRRRSSSRSEPVARKRKRSSRRRRSTSAPRRRRSSRRRGSAAVAVVPALAGAGLTVGGLWALRKWVENKQKTDPAYTLPTIVTTGAPVAAAAVLYAAEKFGGVKAVRPYVAPALAAGAAFLIANFLNKPKGAGARRLRGSGASAARATLANRNRMRRLPGGAGASAARATLAG